MQSGLTADHEDRFIDGGAMVFHRDDRERKSQMTRSMASVQSVPVVPVLPDRRCFCTDKLLQTEALETHALDEEKRCETDDGIETAPVNKLNDPAHIYLREINSISMTQHQAELQVRRALKASEALIEQAVLRTPLAVREIISLGGKLESDNASIRDITARIAEEDSDEASDFQRNRVIALMRQIKHTEQKKRMLRKRLDYGQLSTLEKSITQEMLDNCSEQQVALLQHINLSRKIIQGMVLMLKQRYQRLQNMQDGTLADERKINHIEDDVPLSRAALAETLTTIEEAEGKIQQGRDMLVTAHLGLVVYLAKRYKNRGLDYVDLIQEGNIGLIKAANRFDASKKYHFKSEAIWYIKNAMIRAIVKQGKTIRIPDHVCIIMNKLARASSRLLRETGKEPTVEEIGNIIGIAPDRFRRHSVTQHCVSLDTTAKGREGKSCLGDLIEDNTCMFPGDIVDKRSMHACVKKMMETLNRQENAVVSMRYGIGYESDHTLEKVGQSLALTRQRVKQIEDKAFSKLLKYGNRKGLRAFIEA